MLLNITDNCAYHIFYCSCNLFHWAIYRMPFKFSRYILAWKNIIMMPEERTGEFTCCCVRFLRLACAPLYMYIAQRRIRFIDNCWVLTIETADPHSDFWIGDGLWLSRMILKFLPPAHARSGFFFQSCCSFNSFTYVLFSWYFVLTALLTQIPSSMPCNSWLVLFSSRVRSVRLSIFVRRELIPTISHRLEEHDRIEDLDVPICLSSSDIHPST